MKKVLTILLAGGAGERLYPLTRDRAKPAVPFGGAYRIIDITLSNILNSGLRQVFILTQYKSLSLNRHVRFGWAIFSRELGEFIDILPPMQRTGVHWYLGTADAVYQNLYSILGQNPEHVLILAGDHVYKMNYALMLQRHLETGADVTVGTIRQPAEEAYRFGLVQTDSQGRIIGFIEKPKEGLPPGHEQDGFVNASMGIYLFNTSQLTSILFRDAHNVGSGHDFGKDILPPLVNNLKVYSYDFVDENRKDAMYWRDVGTLDSYYEANMDLTAVNPVFNLYDRKWPIRTLEEQYPPAKFVFSQQYGRMGLALDSIVSHGCIVSGGRVTQSVLSPGVRVHSYSEVDRSILFPDVSVGRHSRLRRCIVDRDVMIPESIHIGFDLEQDRAKGYTVTESGIVVISRPSVLEENLGPMEEASSEPD
ncbi:MAG: glucose-1-phosphate adenylyltransferase [Acidobacteria bacterium RIFCSPLOWO2_12_FULL_54_10]|nr:MAG: glucose-1-phosphate adenylyltransferase [Acidobacteria bacterium RIFCSPLOWO2_12_FULL_54_10]